MNFAWTDCCDWDNSWLSGCKLSFLAGSFTWESDVT